MDNGKCNSRQVFVLGESLSSQASECASVSTHPSVTLLQTESLVLRRFRIKKSLTVSILPPPLLKNSDGGGVIPDVETNAGGLETEEGQPGRCVQRPGGRSEPEAREGRWGGGCGADISGEAAIGVEL